MLKIWLTLNLTNVQSNDAVWLPIDGFLLLFNSNHISIPQHLAFKVARKIFSYLVSLGKNFISPAQLPVCRGNFFQNLMTSSRGRIETFQQTWNWFVYYFLNILLTPPLSHTHASTTPTPSPTPPHTHAHIHRHTLGVGGGGDSRW